MKVKTLLLVKLMGTSPGRTEQIARERDLNGQTVGIERNESLRWLSSCFTSIPIPVFEMEIYRLGFIYFFKLNEHHGKRIKNTFTEKQHTRKTVRSFFFFFLYTNISNIQTFYHTTRICSDLFTGVT